MHSSQRQRADRASPHTAPMSLQTIALESARATLPGEFARIGGTSAHELAAYAGGGDDDGCHGDGDEGG